MDPPQFELGFAYLVALIDVYSRRNMGWRLSNTMSRTFCLDALDALAQGVTDIINSDQGARFTAKDWISALEERGVRVSMDGKGRCLDNIMIERFWRTIKYEEVYLRVDECRRIDRRRGRAMIDAVAAAPVAELVDAPPHDQPIHNF